MNLSAGTRLGPYEVISLLGVGDMGEVWKARDTRLGRLVAIKQLMNAHSNRFEHEAHAIASPAVRVVESLAHQRRSRSRRARRRDERLL